MYWRERTALSNNRSDMKTVLLLIGFILSSIHSAEAQQATKIPRIGYPGRLGSIIEVARIV
jgi:hypothetical protein